MKLIADPSVRNMGTVGGNIAHGDAANDHPTVLIALRARVEITGRGGSRTVPIGDLDALSPYGATHLDIPITPFKVWKVMKEKGILGGKPV